MFNMFKSTAALVLLLGAVSSLPAAPPASVIDQRFFIFGPPPGGGKGPDVEGRGRFGCDNPHPYCSKDNHPKEACTDWGEAWKGWMEENCPEKWGKCGGGGGGPPPGPPGRGRFGCDNPHPYCKKDNHPKEACTDWGEGWKGWMEENCPEKCGKCGGGGGGPPPPPGPSAPGRRSGRGTCEDKKAHCGGWEVYCVGGDYENWMKDNCPKTCGRCDGGTEPTEPPTTECYCGVAKRQSRIINGDTTDINEYPWQAGLVKTGRSWIFCGGSLINNKYVLTAAHCTAGFSAGDVQVLLGEHDKSTSTESKVVRKKLSAIIDHPDYNNRNFDHDYSILKLDSPVNWAENNHIRPVCLPDAGTKYKSGEPVVVTGWGATKSGGDVAGVLQEVTVKYIDNKECNDDYGRGKITPAMLCAAAPSKDACQGDSGGPLVQPRSNNNNYALAGVVSWGYGCADPKYPGVYARVTSVIPWINDNTGDARSCPAK